MNYLTKETYQHDDGTEIQYIDTKGAERSILPKPHDFQLIGSYPQAIARKWQELIAIDMRVNTYGQSAIGVRRGF